MKAIVVVGAWFVAAMLLAGCGIVGGFLDGAGPPIGQVQRVGPVHRLGPVPSFGGPVPFADTEELAFFRTADGWCTQFAGGTGCAGGGPPALPTGFVDFGGTSSPDGACIEAVTGNEVVRIEVTPDDADPVTLHPLGGSLDAPVNVFAACWGVAIDIEAIGARAFDADGDEVVSPVR